MTEFKDLKPGDYFAVRSGYSDSTYLRRVVKRVTKTHIIDDREAKWRHDGGQVGDVSRFSRVCAMVYTDAIRDVIKYQHVRSIVMQILDKIQRATRDAPVPLAVLESIAAAGMALLDTAQSAEKDELNS